MWIDVDISFQESLVVMFVWSLV